MSSPVASRVRSRGITALLLALICLWAPAAAQGPEAGADERKLDLHLRAAVSRGDREPQPVIVTFKRGARRGVIQRLVARGAIITSEFGVIQAVAARLPAGMLRRLAEDRDVAAISTDAPMTPAGIASSVVGNAQQRPYTLRATLGLDTTYLSSDTIQAGDTSGTKGKATSQSWSHTVAPGTNRMLIVSTAHRDGTKYVSQVTYGGTPLSIRMSAGSGNNSAALYYLADPPVGTAPVVVTFTGSVEATVSATNFTGVDLASPFDPGAAAAGASATASAYLANSAPKVVITAIAANGDAKSLAPVNLTALYNDGTGTKSSNILGGLAIRPANGSTSVSWTLGGAKPWGLVSTNLKPGTVVASTAATTRRGAGVTVAVIDSGLLQDGGGNARIKTTRDFTFGLVDPPPVSPVDGYGHGTHVAGLLAGDKTEALGVAPDASYVSLRVLNNAGVGYTSHVINAIQWAIAYRATYGIDVINLSLGHPIFEPAATDPLVQAVEEAVRAGIVVVASAGNMGRNALTGEVGYAGISSPGNAPSAITVGALKTFDTTRRTDDLVADYSSRGPTWYDGFAKPDVVAPAHRLVAAAATGQTLYSWFPDLRQSLGGRPYLLLSGTSMATAVVSGTVATLIEQARSSFGATPTPNTIKAMLQQSALPMSDAGGQPYHVLEQGAGAVNPIGALSLAQAIDITRPVGNPWLVTGVNETTTIDGQNIVWGDNIIWGDNIVWGDALYTNRTAWANNIVWGDNIVWGSNIVWGDNIVWGENIVWGNNIIWGNNIVWGSNIVWGDNIIWGDNIVWGDTTTSTNQSSAQLAREP